MIKNSETLSSYDENIESNEVLFSSFIKTWRTVLNLILEEEVSETSRDQIKSSLNFFNGTKLRLEFTSKDKSKEMLKIMQHSLVESVFVRQSIFIRLVLKDVFDKEYDCTDFDMLQFIIDSEWLPQVFSRDNESPLHLEENISLQIDKVLNMKLEWKKLGSLFDSYVTSYPFSANKAREELKLLSGRILVFENFFLWFSDYIPLYKKTLDVLMNEEGYFPIDWRYFIAIMAVSTVRSQYLFSYLKEQFLLKGGKEDWVISGLPAVPEKIQKLAKLNNILAHRPWKLITDDLNEILSKGWSREELLHAAMIMIFYHKLASLTESLKFKFVEASGILPVRTPSFSSSEAKEEREGKLKLYNNLLQMNEETQETKIKIERKFSNGDDPKIVYKIEEEHSNFDNFISNYCTLYLDYDAHSDSISSNMNFNWDDEGYYILQNISARIVDTIHSELKFVVELSSNTIGGDNKYLDTFHFRNSIRVYIEKIFGILNEDYDYTKTNKLLLKTTKSFIKNIACMPQKISVMDLPALLNTFSHEEIFHMIFISSTIKEKIELTFFSRTLYEIIKSID